MTRIDLPYLAAPKGRSRRYWYYRRHGRWTPIATIDGRRLDHDDPGFLEAYDRIHASFETVPPPPGAAPGSLAHLITGYLASAEFAQLGDRTKSDYRTHTDELRRRFGRHPAAAMTRDFVLELRDRHVATPSRANHLIMMIRLLFNWGLERKKRFGLDINPAGGIKRLKEGAGHRPWEEGEIAAFRAAWPGPPARAGASWERVAMELGLNSGQRAGDVNRMTRAQVDDGWLVVASQRKTGQRVDVPLSDDLAGVLTPWLRSHGHMMILPGERGAPLKQRRFQERFRAACNAAGLPSDCTFHGLRYTAAGVLNELAPIIHDGHRISAGRAVATGLTAIFETDCRRGWRLLFGARPAAPAAWFRALGR